ncbi:MAG: hypothetical protein JWP91_4728 [Fibrobacteres bacterium]|nr:hypothetical protein [Fibrobacterota bacterium]
MKPFNLLRILILASFLGPSHAGTSRLWGARGELWDPLGRLPDFSYAGYHAGAGSPPSPAVVANVRDFGCLADGRTDDSPCLQAAIDAAGGGALLIPKGRYLVARQIQVRKSGLVLRGEGSGPDGTVLVWSKGLRELTGNIYPSNWGAGGLLRFAPPIPAQAPPDGLAKAADHPPTHDLALGALLGPVSTAAKRGDTHLRLATPVEIKPGQFIVLTQIDPPDKSLNAHLHNGQGSNGYNQDMPLRWVAQIRSVDGTVLELAQPLRFDVRPEWKPRINRYRPIEESGVENLRCEFPDTAYPGHQLEEGFNALAFEGALNCWARNLVLKNCDNGPSLEELTKNCSVLDLTQLPRTILAINGRISGHHGFSFNIDSHDNLLSGFDFKASFIHGVSVGYNASGNVARSGRGSDLNLDHHSRSPFENLYSDLDLGLGAYPYLPVAGAGGDVLRSGARGTVWNVRTAKGPVTPPPFAFVQFNVVGTTEDKRTTDREWLETLSDPEPADLYASQVERRLGRVSGTNGPSLRPNARPKTGGPGSFGVTASGRKALRQAHGRSGQGWVK